MLSFNVEEGVIVIRIGWTPKKRRRQCTVVQCTTVHCTTVQEKKTMYSGTMSHCTLYHCTREEDNVQWYYVPLSPSSVIQCTVVHCITEEGDRVVKNFGCVIIVIIKFVDQDVIEFLYCFLYVRQPVEFFNVIYIYIYNSKPLCVVQLLFRQQTAFVRNVLIKRCKWYIHRHMYMHTYLYLCMYYRCPRSIVPYTISW